MSSLPLYSASATGPDPNSKRRRRRPRSYRRLIFLCCGSLLLAALAWTSPAWRVGGEGRRRPAPPLPPPPRMAKGVMGVFVDGGRRKGLQSEGARATVEKGALPAEVGGENLRDDGFRVFGGMSWLAWGGGPTWLRLDLTLRLFRFPYALYCGSLGQRRRRPLFGLAHHHPAHALHPPAPAPVAAPVRPVPAPDNADSPQRGGVLVREAGAVRQPEGAVPRV